MQGVGFGAWGPCALDPVGGQRCDEPQCSEPPGATSGSLAVRRSLLGMGSGFRDLRN